MSYDHYDPDPYRHAPLTWDPRPDRPGYVTHLGPATIYRHDQKKTRGGFRDVYRLQCEAHGSGQIIEVLETAKARLYEPGSFCSECKANPLPLTWGLSNARTK